MEAGNIEEKGWKMQLRKAGQGTSVCVKNKRKILEWKRKAYGGRERNWWKGKV